MATPPTDAQRLERIRDLRRQHDDLTAQAEQVRRQILTEVRDAFPRNRGEDEDPPRGWLTQVVNASGWTRAYVADIRDGKVSSDG